MPLSDRSSKNARFRKSNRLRKRRDFLSVQRGGQKYHFTDILAFFLQNKGNKRVGITASKKVGGAVLRNRFKRLVREALRREWHLIPEDVDVVVIAKRRAVKTNLESIRLQLGQLGRRIKKGCQVMDIAGGEAGEREIK